MTGKPTVPLTDGWQDVCVDLTAEMTGEQGCSLLVFVVVSPAQPPNPTSIKDHDKSEVNP